MKRLSVFTFTVFFFSLLVGGQAYGAVPTASSVTVLGSPLYNSTPNPDEFTTLTADYVYDDTDFDAENGTTFQWYRSLNSDGTGLTAIGGATSKRYAMTSGDIGYYFYVEVTPVDANAETGVAVTSGASPLAAATSFEDVTFNNTTVSTSADYLNADMQSNNRSLVVDGSGVVLNLHGDYDMANTNGTTITVRNGATLRVFGNFITKNNVNITVDGTSSFVVESSLEAQNGSNINISGTLTVNGDVEVEQNATFAVATGGSIDVNGDFQNGGGNGTITIEGDMSVDGNMTVGDGTTITVDSDDSGGGTLTVGGDLSGGNGATISGFGPVSVGGDVTGDPGFTGDSQLPIELLSFTVAQQSGGIAVRWATLSETNNHYFTIERSADGKSYTAVAEIAGAGNSNSTLYYQWTDEAPLAGRSYYRLRQTDYDGQQEVFSVEVVETAMNVEWSVYPNPASGSFTLQWPQDVDASLQIISMDGRMILEDNHSAVEGITTRIYTDGWQAGMYMVRIMTQGQTLSTKLIIR